MLSIAFNVRFELQTWKLLLFHRVIGAQIDVTHVWQTLEKFGSELVKIWQNLTKFDRVTSKFSNRSFPQYNLDGPKSCQILSIFFWCLSNFYMSFLIFSRCCQIPVLAFNVRFELQLRSLLACPLAQPLSAWLWQSRWRAGGGKIRPLWAGGRFHLSG